MESRGTVAIIGAGISGLSCAQALRASGVEARLFERAVRVGGRCATKLWQGHLVDHGVQYFTAQTPEFKRELLNRLRQFRPIIPPVSNAQGKIMVSPGGPRFYVLQGNNYLAQVMSHGLDVRLNSRVEEVTFGGDGVEISGQTYQAVVSSLPAPQTARLFGLPKSPADYVCCISALLEYAGLNVGKSAHRYGYLLPDEEEPLHASYCENHKAGRIMDEKTVFVVQAGFRFSLANADEPPEKYLSQLIEANNDLWEIAEGKCTASFGHRWRLSWPRTETRQAVPLPPGAFMCGDSLSGSTVEEVWLDGRRAAEEVLDFLAAGLPTA
jgi:renalase